MLPRSVGHPRWLTGLGSPVVFTHAGGPPHERRGGRSTRQSTTLRSTSHWVPEKSLDRGNDRRLRLQTAGSISRDSRSDRSRALTKNSARAVWNIRRLRSERKTAWQPEVVSVLDHEGVAQCLRHDDQTAMSVTFERIQLAISSSTHATAFAEIL